MQGLVITGRADARAQGGSPRPQVPLEAEGKGRGACLAEATVVLGAGHSDEGRPRRPAREAGPLPSRSAGLRAPTLHIRAQPGKTVTQP